jgi:hypothetical protein
MRNGKKLSNSNKATRSAAITAVQALEPRILFAVINGDGPEDPDGMIVPADVTPVITPAPAGTSPAILPLSSVPQLHSNPGAGAALYLDFVGAPAQTWGAYSVPQTPAFDQDGDATTFSSGEIAAIQETWARIAEKYSPFNIDVTTVAPGSLVHGQNLEVVIGGTGTWTFGTYGGLSYTGAFATGGTFSPNVSWVFSQNLANAPQYIAEASAHEAGHEFGLTHHSTWSGTTLASEYDPGNALTAPIMGNSYSAQRGIWENGLSDASSTSYQDDMAIISNATNGFGYRAQDHGQTRGTANALTLSGTSISGSGVIEKTTDTDYFSFTTGAGAVTLNVNVAQYGATLHARAQLFDANGNLIATAADANSLAQTISTTLAAGTYYIAVESYGQYGDVGQYTVSGSVAAVSASNPTLTLSGAASVNELAAYTLNLSASDPGHTISSWIVNWGDGSSQTVTGNPSTVTHTYASGPHAYTINASATDDTGSYSAGNTVAVSVAHVPPTLAISGAASVVERALYTLSLSATDPNHTISSWAINWGDGTAVQTVTGNPSSATHTYSLNGSYTISATATDDVSTYSAGNTRSVSVSHAAPTLTLSGVSSTPERGTYTLGLAYSDTGHTLSSWLVNWGDGSTQTVAANLSSVTHSYSVGPHAYTISATATDDVGTYSANNVAINVTHVAPTLSISGVSSITERSLYTLSLSASDPNHTVSAWTFNWGDGSAAQNVTGNPTSVTHTFALSGIYTISATATDDVGTYAAGNVQGVNVGHVAPTVSISGASTAAEFAAYTLALSATDPGHTVSGWSINWGDGSALQSVTGNPSSVAHTFAAGPHSYTISASATDDVGTYSAGNTQGISVTHTTPVLGISGAASVNEGSTYTLSLSASDPGHAISGWSINWGDGAVQAVTGTPTSVTHVYADGTNLFTIAASATDDVGTYNASSRSVTVNDVPPTLAISGATSISAGATYTLAMSATDPGGDTISGWTINWGDGSSPQLLSGNPSSVSHVFALGGRYNITASATNEDGTFNANVLSVAVGTVAPTIQVSGAASSNQYAAYTLTLGAASDPSGGPVTQYIVHWGDGTTDSFASIGDKTHTYSSAGAQAISVDLVDQIGTFTNAGSSSVNVVAINPTLTLSGAGSATQGQAYTLNLSATGAGSETISGWSINWGDGNLQTFTGNPGSVQHIFTSASDFTITATATNGGWSGNSNAQAVHVAAAVIADTSAPTATFSAQNVTDPNAAITITVQFSDDQAVSLASLGSSNLLVSGPNGFSQLATLVGVSSSQNSPVMTATYSIAAPVGGWKSSNSGTYTVALQANQVQDSSGNFAAPGTLGTVSVTIKPGNVKVIGSAAPKKSLSRSAVGAALPQGQDAYYAVSVASISKLTVNLSGEKDVMGFELLDENMQVIATKTGKKGLSLATMVNPGTYYVHVIQEGVKSNKFRVGITARALSASAVRRLAGRAL